ncbi:MAG: ammonia-forming cytochrome c nitrite reductase subunit c552 [Deltaproteobacteria bacterium]|nr:ammonia-forming cytochrome c nitrite reductase subunit c552 [Deltaproteobacteria bacterium]
MSEKQEPEASPKKTYSTRRLAAVAAAAALGSALLVGLLVNVFERRTEARNPFFRVVELNEDTDDPAVWGRNFPLQYDRYRRTVDMERTRWGGSEAMRRAPTVRDPRGVVSQSRLEEDPSLRTLWAGYAFAVDFREERGHAYMLTDQENTRRQDVVRQPGTCIHCHASTWTAYRRLGGGDITRGFEALNHMPYAEARSNVRHPVACIDCHDPATMALRVTRPAFIEGMRGYMAARGRPDYDPNRDATHQELRSFVCGQCHVEYYFRGPEKRLTYPWAGGLRADEILAYYERDGHRDWTHAESGARVLKAQHPEFELYNQGIHARAGVSCTDCHMPYLREGGLKITDHHVRSPLLNIANACQTCHRVSEAELRGRAEAIQDRTHGLRDRAMEVVIELIHGIGAARAAGATDTQLEGPRREQLRAQFLLDFIEAENSSGFHAPGEAARVLFLSVDHAHQGLRALGVRPSLVPLATGDAGYLTDAGTRDASPATDATSAMDAGVPRR